VPRSLSSPPASAELSALFAFYTLMHLGITPKLGHLLLMRIQTGGGRALMEQVGTCPVHRLEGSLQPAVAFKTKKGLFHSDSCPEVDN
jgi:hypothetical protein